MDIIKHVLRLQRGRYLGRITVDLPLKFNHFATRLYARVHLHSMIENGSPHDKLYMSLFSK